MGETREVDGADLFSVRSLNDPGRFIVFNRTLTEMRIKARQTPITSCHSFIAALFDAGRLLRCYTQNIDGLQTRDRPDMAEVVLEMHGSNAELVCHKCRKRPARPVEDFDQPLLEDGYAVCPSCKDDSESNENRRSVAPVD